MTYDAIIVGGSYAGLSAGLQLARARRSILVVDAGERRNRFAEHAHGFLAQDGRPPAEIAAVGRKQLLAYPSVEWADARAENAEPDADGFRVALADGRSVSSRKLVLATGVVDELPDTPGLSERWGRSVFHCPYCHGYELGDGPIGVLAASPLSIHHALMLPDWGKTTFFLNDVFEPDPAQSADLELRGVAVVRGKVAGLRGERAEVAMADGRVFALEGLFVATRTRMASPLAERLGCAFEEGPAGSFIRTDALKATSVPGVFACGDAARAMGSVAFAVGDGALAGAMTHRSLMFGDQ